MELSAVRQDDIVVVVVVAVAVAISFQTIRGDNVVLNVQDKVPGLCELVGVDKELVMHIVTRKEYQLPEEFKSNYVWVAFTNITGIYSLLYFNKRPSSHQKKLSSSHQKKLSKSDKDWRQGSFGLNIAPGL